MRQTPPGSYGPEFSEPGFTEKGGFFDAGFQVSVNHYGGNLIVSATDVSIASQGKFGLFFKRTYNSYKASPLNHLILDQADSPLGLGWTYHYGILWPALFPSFRPEFVDGTGARHIFYRHDHLDTVIPIASSGGYPTWISASLEILTQINSDNFVLFTPEGLKYEFRRIPQYAYLVPWRISDVYGNSWEISYEPDLAPYFEHPLVRSVTDGFQRRLSFVYTVPNAATGKKRLFRVSLDSTPLAEYEYQHLHPHAFLWRHRTAESRVTEYATDTAPLPAFGTIRRIVAPTGGATEIGYALQQFYYQPLQPRTVYAVQTLRRGGHTWTYNYLSGNGLAPANDLFRVRVTTDDGLVGEYDYYTYGSPAVWLTAVWKVGLLMSSTESFNRTTRTRSYQYEPFQISQQVYDQSTTRISAPRLVSETRVQDGHPLTTTYAMHDAFNFPRQILKPGNVRHDFAYQHVIIGGSNARYLLGLKASEEVRAGPHLVEKTVWQYRGSNPALPDLIQFYRDPTTAVDVRLAYHATNGFAGSIETKQFGRYFERYAYSNGVVRQVDYAEGPGISRVINRDGTIDQETRYGVTKASTWDRDFRLGEIRGPDAPVSIQYAATQVTVTQGPRPLRLTYDGWGRLTERRERIEGSVEAVHTYGGFDSMDRATTETTSSGAQYSLSYDVEGRLRARTATDDTHTFAYRTDGAGITIVETMNGSVVYERKGDFLGRILFGSTNGHRVDYSYAGAVQTIQPQGVRTRIVARDFFENKTEETHPETGTLRYRYSRAEGWLEGVTRPGISYAYMHDARGRVREIYREGRPRTLLVRKSYDRVFGRLEMADHHGVKVEYQNPDAAGRPRAVRTTIPRPLGAPTPMNRAWYWDLPLPPPPPARSPPPPPGIGVVTLLPPSDPLVFTWTPVAGADAYDVEVGEPQGPPGPRQPVLVRVRAKVQDVWATFESVGFTHRHNQTYYFRVRARKTQTGEIGPFSRWERFVVFDHMAVLGQDAEDRMWLEAPPPPAIRETGNAVFVVNIRYDSLGRMSEIQHPDLDTTWDAAHATGKWQRYQYNAQNRHDTVSYAGQPIVANTVFHPTGLPQSTSVNLLGPAFTPAANVVHMNRTHNHLGRLRSLTVTSPSDVFYRAMDMEYNDFGFLRSFRRDDPGLRGLVEYGYNTGAELETFTMTVAGRAYRSQFIYDNARNFGGTTGFFIPGLQNYGPGGATTPSSLIHTARGSVSFDTSNRMVGAGYDLDGRVTSDQEFEYVYTDLDQVRTVRSRNWDHAQFLYDADGNRVREVYEDRVVYSIRGPDGRLLSQEIYAPWNLLGLLPFKKDIVYYDDIPLVEVRYDVRSGPSPEYQFRDRLGSPVVTLSGRSQFVPEYLEYSPYGQQMRTRHLPWDVTLEFTGHERDHKYPDRNYSYGLLHERDYMRMRYYDQLIGRFNRPDPAFDFDELNPASFNLYAYTRNNPVNRIDPLGLYSYVYDWDLGPLSPEFTAGSVMRKLQSDPNRYFPFSVVPQFSGDSAIEVGNLYDLRNVRFPLDRDNPVRVTEKTPTRFTFTTLEPHFSGTGATVQFITYEKEGRVLLRHVGIAPEAGLFTSITSDFFTWAVSWRLMGFVLSYDPWKRRPANDMLRESLPGRF
jgi:RHS repeat-associated protein